MEGIPAYREAIEQVNNFNSRLLLDRKYRMPYIDNQTGIAQQDCHLWVSRVQRCSPVKEGQIYSYPARRWRVKKRPDFITVKKPRIETEDTQESTQDASTVADDSMTSFDQSSQGSTVYEEYYEEETFDSEFDSDEEFGKKRKGRKPGKGKGGIKGNRNALAQKLAGSIRTLSREEIGTMSQEDRKKPYDCQLCRKRYKNQQGLRYHYEHYNHDLEDPSTSSTSSTTQQPIQLQPRPPPPTPPQPPVEVEPQPVVQEVADTPAPDHVAGAKRQKGMPPSSYCDFCLGDAEENKKSGVSEELISCADCGRSGHPTCLQFNDNLTGQVKKYKWQCIECKCCCLCGTSDNDEQLLFCDDCDRGYHMYCLTPPIAEPPEGSWQCQLCEARVKNRDISKVAVLPEHMDTKR